jgi:ATP-dependent Clp protease protease subunit
VKKKKVIRLSIVGEIGPDTISAKDENGLTIVDVIKLCNSPAFQLEISLSSPGGDIDVGMTLYELLRCSKAHVVIEGYGIVASIAVLIFMAGDKRVLSPGTRLFVHPGSIMSDMPENIFTVKVKANELMGLHTWYCEQLYSRAAIVRSQVKLGDIRALCDKDSFFGADEALDMGIATHVTPYAKK